MNDRHYFEEAVKGRLALLRFLGDREKGRILMIALHGRNRYMDMVASGDMSQLDGVQQFMYEHIKRAPMFCLTPPECEALERSWASYPTTTAFPTDVVPPAGIVYFSAPLTDPQDGDPETPVRAFMWNVLKRKDLPFTGYIPRCDEDDYILYVIGFTTDGTIVEGNTGQDRPHMYPNVSVSWLLGVEDGGVVVDDPVWNAFATKNRMSYVKVLLTYFALMRQTYFEASKPHEVTKKTRDRLKFASKNHSGLSTDIQIVKFRPRTGSGSKVSAKSGTGKKLTKSTWTIPFWRWQWYPSTEENKPILMDSFARGPDKATTEGVEKIFRPPKPLGQKPVHEKED